jgi:WD40 repeat protein
MKQIADGVLDGRSSEKEEAKIVQDMSECVLVGHSGPVYATSIMIDDKYLLSASHDTTVRKWSLLTRSCLVVYQSH